MIKDVYLNRVIDLKSRIDKERSFLNGLKAGIKNQKIETLLIMYTKGYATKEIASIVRLSESEVAQAIKEYELRKKSGVNTIPIVTI